MANNRHRGRPYQHLNVVGNDLVQCEEVVGLNGRTLLAVDRGSPPRVSISAPSLSDKSKPMPIVDHNLSLLPVVKVNSYGKTRTVVHAGDRVVLEVVERGSKRADVTEIDLRPLGVALYKDEGGIRVGRSLLKNNTFKNARFMLNLKP